MVGGGGLTGVELVGEYADMRSELARKYGIDPQEITLYCVEAAPSILPGFPAELVDRATTSLQKRGVNFLTGLPITKMDGTTVELKDGSTIETSTLVWTGGVQGNPLWLTAASKSIADVRLLTNSCNPHPTLMYTLQATARWLWDLKVVHTRQRHSSHGKWAS